MKDEFKSYRSYWDFAHSVSKWRFMRSPDDEAFLRTLASTAVAKIEEMAEGVTLWRAQTGHDLLNGLHDCVEIPLKRERMKPPADWWTAGQAPEGRINPKGSPVF